MTLVTTNTSILWRSVVMNRVMSECKLNGITFEHIVRDSAFNMPSKHFHDEYELYYLCAGGRFYFIDNQTYLIEPGSIVLINQHQIHKTSPSDSLFHDRILVEFHEASMPHLKLLDIDLKAFFNKYEGVVKLRKEEQLNIENYFQTIFHEFDKKQAHYKAQVQLKLSEMLIYISRILPTHSLPTHNQSPKQQKVNEISDYIASTYYKPLSLNNLANQFFLNKSYLSRIFKEITGFTVNEYIYITKIKKAQELLVNTDWAISKIATSLGYSSLTYFERIFKKYTETTPTRYRKRMNRLKNPARDRLNLPL